MDKAARIERARKGGFARSKNMTKAQRTASARRAAYVRWLTKRKPEAA